MLVAVFVAVVSLLLGCGDQRRRPVDRARNRPRTGDVGACGARRRPRPSGGAELRRGRRARRVRRRERPWRGMARGHRARSRGPRHAPAFLPDCDRRAGGRLRDPSDGARRAARGPAAVLAGVSKRSVDLAANQPAQRRRPHLARGPRADRVADGDDAGAARGRGSGRAQPQQARSRRDRVQARCVHRADSAAGASVSGSTGAASIRQSVARAARRTDSNRRASFPNCRSADRRTAAASISTAESFRRLENSRTPKCGRPVPRISPRWAFR